MRIVFMGTPSFAVPSLKRLVEDGYEVTLAITQPDKPKGRKRELTPPPVKEYALSVGIPVYQPASLRTDEAYARIAAETPDVIVVAAYGKILPSSILQLPPHGCINVHGSLLPQYRGAAPIQWAVLNGETETGITTMQMDAGLDTGDILLTSRRLLNDTVTAGELYDQLAEDGAVLLAETLIALQNGTLCPQKQNDADSSYAAMLSKEMSPLHWDKAAKRLHDQVRGLNPWPSASCLLDGKTLKVHQSRVGSATDAAPGTVVSVAPFAVACGDGNTLELIEVQYEGSRRMAAADFLRGHPVAVGTVL